MKYCFQVDIGVLNHGPKAKHLTPTPPNAVRRYAQRARQFLWQCRSHTGTDDHLVQHFFDPFDFVGHIEFNACHGVFSNFCQSGVIFKKKTVFNMKPEL